MDNRQEPFSLPPQQVTIEDLVIDSANKAAVYNYNKDKTSLPMVLHNYTFSHVPTGIVDFTGGRYWNDPIIVPPVVVPPVTPPVTPPVDSPIVVKPVNNDTTRIKGSYTVTAKDSIILFTGTTSSKLTFPATMTEGYKITVINKGTVNLAFNRRVYFTNGQYRLMIKPKEAMWMEYRIKRSRLTIIKRTY